MLIEPHIAEPSERSVLPWDDSFSSLWRSSRSTPPDGKLIKSWLDGPWLPLLSGNGCIELYNPSLLPAFPTLLAYLRMASRFLPFPRGTPRYHKTKYIAILIWNQSARRCFCFLSSRLITDYGSTLIICSRKFEFNGSAHCFLDYNVPGFIKGC